MRVRLAPLCVALFLWVSCAPGVDVVVNERLFELPSMKSRGGGCAMYELRKDTALSSGGGSTSGSGGTSPSGLVVSQTSAGEIVLVKVSDQGHVLAERRYGEGFLRSEKVDEFVVRGFSGDQMMLRYWGTFDPDGRPRCAPFEDDGARPKMP